MRDYTQPYDTDNATDHSLYVVMSTRIPNKRWLGAIMTQWPLKFKWAMFGSGEGERGTFFVVFLDPITRIESAPKESVRRLNETTLHA